jgi:ribosomal protein S27AE
MIDPSTFFNISNVLFLLGTSLLIRAVLKNRNILKGYDWLGALLTVSAMLLIQYAYIGFIQSGLTSYWVSFGFSLPTVAYWVLVTAYSIKNKLQKGKIEIKEIEDDKKIKEKRTCQGCGSPNLRHLYDFQSFPSGINMERFYCNECGHVSIYAKGEKNWRVG